MLAEADIGEGVEAGFERLMSRENCDRVYSSFSFRRHKNSRVYSSCLTFERLKPSEISTSDISRDEASKR